MGKTDTAHPTHSAQHHASKFTKRQRTIALIVVALAFVMDLLDNTIVNIAIPSIQGNLGASYSAIQWLIAGYSLAFAVFLITGGRLGDVIGYKKMFLFGVAGFTFASLLSGVAWSTEILIAARLIQGVFAALMVPQVMSLMQVMFKPSERGAVLGLFGALAGVAASLGPVIGGLLISANIWGLDWRPIFLINIPVGIFAFIAAIRYLPEGKSPHPLKLDIIGTLLIIVALVLVVFPLIQGRELGWPLWIFVMMVGSLPFFFLFAWWQKVKEKKDNSPLVVPGLFRIKTFNVGITINLIFESAMLGVFLPLTLLLQIGLGYSVIEAALTGIATALGISLTMILVSQRLIAKFGRNVMLIGTVTMALGLTIVYLVVNANGVNTTPWEFVPGLFITGMGMALIMSPMFSVVLADVNPKNAGSASGTLNAVQQLGGAIGVAVIGVIFFGQLTAHSNSNFVAVQDNVKKQLTELQIPAEAQTQIVDGVRTCFNDRNSETDSSVVPDSCKALTGGPQTPATEKISGIINDAIKTANTSNFTEAFKAAVVYEAVILAVIFGLTFLLPRKIVVSDAGH